ncbi:MAG: hypothetical protein GY795_28625, partial [Desulfobacterales bacterium]|nr:hypothetical protein [Desulfobacterales bacterium]
MLKKSNFILFACMLLIFSSVSVLYAENTGQERDSEETGFYYSDDQEATETSSETQDGIFSHRVTMYDDDMKTIYGAVSIFDNYFLVHNLMYRRENNYWIPEGKLTPDNGSAISNYSGDYTDIHGDYAIIGNSKGNSDGEAYIFKREGDKWNQTDTLVPPGEQSSLFGEAVAIFDDFAMVGAYHASEGGAVYVYQRHDEQWYLVDTLTGDDPIDGKFGSSVAISGEFAIIGAKQSGTAYIYRRVDNQWNRHAELLPSKPYENSQFGWSVDISGDYAIVGAYMDASAYIYKKNGEMWSLQKRLSSDIGNDLFGKSVSIRWPYAAVGANKAEPYGATYIFRESGNDWILATTLTGKEYSDVNQFGYSVEMSGNYLLVSGSACVFGPTPENEYTVSGKIADKDNIGIAGVKLTGFPEETFTDDDGIYSVT